MSLQVRQPAPASDAPADPARPPRPGLPPGPRAPRAVQTLRWVADPLRAIERAWARYGDTFTLTAGRERLVVLTDPADVKQVFTGDPAIYHAGKAAVMLRPFLGHKSVFLLDDHAHLTQRRLLLPPFHGERMRTHLAQMRDIAEREVATWPLGTPFALHPRMQEVTLHAIVRIVFGVAPEDPNMEELRARLQAVLGLTGNARQMLRLLIAGPDKAERRGFYDHVTRPVDEVIYATIRERRAAPDLAERDDVLSMLLLARHEDGRPMEDAELRDELVTLLVAGHEVTATALSWTLERVTRHPDALERLNDEVRAGAGDAYLDAVIRETLRLRPVIPFVGRVLQEPVEIGGHLVPAGERLAPAIYLVHRREELYPDATAFRPERWLGARPNPYTFFPYGGGVRRCIGASFAEAQMRAVLETIFRRVRLAPDRPEPEAVARRVIAFVPKRGARVVASRA